MITFVEMLKKDNLMKKVRILYAPGQRVCWRRWNDSEVQTVPFGDRLFLN
jgi:hypothetical protein